MSGGTKLVQKVCQIQKQKGKNQGINMATCKDKSAYPCKDILVAYQKQAGGTNPAIQSICNQTTNTDFAFESMEPTSHAKFPI